MTLARYTPAEARALEDHYIACAKAEGILAMLGLVVQDNNK